jgi:hypothetical protein
VCSSDLLCVTVGVAKAWFVNTSLFCIAVLVVSLLSKPFQRQTNEKGFNS